MFHTDLKASNFVAVFDFQYKSSRVTEHALASLSGRTRSYAVVSNNPPTPLTFHNEY